MDEIRRDETGSEVEQGVVREDGYAASEVSDLDEDKSDDEDSEAEKTFSASSLATRCMCLATICNSISPPRAEAGEGGT